MDSSQRELERMNESEEEREERRRRGRIMEGVKGKWLEWGNVIVGWKGRMRVNERGA